MTIRFILGCCGTEATEFGWDGRTHQMLTRIIVVYCVDARPMRDVCKVLHLETCLGSNKDAGGDMGVASDGQRPGRKKGDIWINSDVGTNRNIFNANERYTFMDHHVMPQ
jgi:hypothetical protein